MKEKRQCEHTKKASLWSNHYVQCPHNAKVERDGKWYCGVHDPVSRRQKQDERDKKSSERYAEQKETWRRKIAETHYCEKLTTEYLETHQARPTNASTVGNRTKKKATCNTR